MNSSDEVERRRVMFLGYSVKDQLFSGRNAVGETVEIAGVRFTVIGVMDRKLQLSQLFHQRRPIGLHSVLRGRRPVEHALRAGDGVYAGGAAVREDSQSPGAGGHCRAPGIFAHR